MFQHISSMAGEAIVILVAAALILALLALVLAEVAWVVRVAGRIGRKDEAPPTYTPEPTRLLSDTWSRRN
jgi:hypothetical protein